MAYQITRAQNLIDSLQLVSPDGDIKAEISINLNLSQIARDFRPCYLRLVQAQQKYRQAQESENVENSSELIAEVGESVISLYNLIFGTEETRQIIDFFDGDYFEMIAQTIPFIHDVIAPAITNYVKQQRKNLIKMKGLFGR